MKGEGIVRQENLTPILKGWRKILGFLGCFGALSWQLMDGWSCFKKNYGFYFILLQAILLFKTKLRNRRNLNTKRGELKVLSTNAINYLQVY